jgi:hypothetical protein
MRWRAHTSLETQDYWRTYDQLSIWPQKPNCYGRQAILSRTSSRSRLHDIIGNTASQKIELKRKITPSWARASTTDQMRHSTVVRAHILTGRGWSPKGGQRGDITWESGQLWRTDGTDMSDRWEPFDTGRLARLLAVVSKAAFGPLAWCSQTTHNNQQYDTSQVPSTLGYTWPNPCHSVPHELIICWDMERWTRPLHTHSPL